MARTLHCGYVPKAREQIAAHLRAQESAATAIDPGYGKQRHFSFPIWRIPRNFAQRGWTGSVLWHTLLQVIHKLPLN